jgi:hypothetical protein
LLSLEFNGIDAQPYCRQRSSFEGFQKNRY